jgi:hypothetical protein
MFINKHLRTPQLHCVYTAQILPTSRTQVAAFGYCILSWLRSYENQTTNAGMTKACKTLVNPRHMNVSTRLRRITTFRSTTDSIYDGGPDDYNTGCLKKNDPISNIYI